MLSSVRSSDLAPYTPRPGINSFSNQVILIVDASISTYTPLSNEVLLKKDVHIITNTPRVEGTYFFHQVRLNIDAHITTYTTWANIFSYSRRVTPETVLSFMAGQRYFVLDT